MQGVGKGNAGQLRESRGAPYQVEIHEGVVSSFGEFAECIKSIKLAETAQFYGKFNGMMKYFFRLIGRHVKSELQSNRRNIFDGFRMVE